MDSEERALDGVLDLAQLEADEIAPLARPVDVRAWLDATLEAHRPLADAKGLAFEIEVPKGLPTLSFDPDLLERAVNHLVHNAIAFTDQGSVVVRARYDAGRLAVEVSDTGIGMAPDDLDRVFAPFQQLSEGDARTHEGNGLGLAVVQGFASLMGGEVTVESAPGEGSRFRIAVPAPPSY